MRARAISIVAALALTSGVSILPAQEAGPAGPSPGVSAPLATEYLPLTRSERLRDYLNGTFGLGSLSSAALHADFQQLTHSPKEWGRDPAGFGQRVGSVLAQHVIRGTLEYGASSVLHEDNRYLRSGQTGFWRRTKYAVASSFLARHPNGRRSLSISKIGSTAGASFISRAWMPGSVAGAAAGASSFGASIGFGVAMNVVREFWPDIKHRFRRH